MKTPSTQSAGFTLIELVVAIVVASVLVAVGFPSYQEHMRKARRAEATASLMAAAQALERYYTENNKYADAPTAVFPSATYYTLSFNGAATASAYSIRAVPRGAQSGDKCGTYTLDNLGQKGVSSGTVAACW
jgi:type IV pilus assembly protein PilE